MPQNTGIPIIVQGNSYNLVIPLQIYIVDEGEMVLQDFTPDVADVVKISLKCKERTYNFAPTITGNEATIALTGHEVVGIYAIEVVIVQADGTQYRSLRTDQFVIIDSSDDLTEDEIIEGLEENVIYINPQLFIAGERGRSIVDVSLTSTAGLVDTYTITYSDGTTSTFNVTNGSGQLVIVNDLTTGGVEKGLSAEMGKKLSEAVNEVDTLLDDYVVSETTQLTIYNAGAGIYINASAKIASGSNTYSVKYFEVEAGKKVRLTLGYSGSGTIASNAYAAAWFTSQPHYQDVGVLAIQDNLVTAITNSPIILSVPTGVTHLAVTMMSTGGSASAEYIEDYLDVVQMSDIEDEIKAVDEVTEEVMIVPTTSQLSAQFISQTSRKIAGASLQGYYVHYVPCTKGDKFVVRFSGDFSSVVDAVGAAWFAAVQPANNSPLLMPAIMDGEDGMKLNSVTANHDYEVTVPSGALWLCVQKYSTNTTTIHKKVRRVDSEKMTTNVEWSVPDTIYAVVGKKKRLYLDCIIKNYDNLIVGLPWGTYTSSLYIVQNCLIINPSSTGTTEVTLFAYDKSGNVVGSKTISIVTIANALPQTPKRVCILGDSITEVQNMAYYMENELKRMFGDDNTALPQFCGTKIKSYAAGGSNKLTRNEGHYGHSYSWLLGSSSPFYNAEKSGDDKIDIANWRTADGFKGDSTRVYNGCGLQANEKIDVLSLAMGHNGTADKESAATQLEALKTLIAYFKADNPNTKFIIQMIPLLGGNKNIDKLNSLYYWRELVLNDEDFASDDNIIIGDMGCCYDRWNAYNREFVVPDTCYPNDEVEIFKVNSGYGYATADTQHPSAEGSQQLGEGAIPALLAMVQEVGTEDGEELTTYTPAAVVNPEPVTLQSLKSTKADKRTLVDNSSMSGSVELSVNGYHNLGVVNSVSVTLPSSANRTDEFLFTFTCDTAACTLSLPSGVELGSELDFSADVAAGRKFQVSIMDGIALYTFIDE